MFNDPLPVAILQVVLLVIMSLCTGAEAAILSVNDYRMKELAKDGNKKAKRVIRLMEKEGRVISSVQTALMTLTVAISVLGALAYTDKFENSLVGILAVILLQMVVLVVAGDMIPKKICTSKPDESAMGLSLFISWIWMIFRPVSFLLNGFSKLFVALSGNDPDGETASVTEDEIMMMVDLGSEKGTIAPGEKELITNIFEFGDNCADDVMTHRKDVTVLMSDESVEEWEKIVRESGFSRFPVCGEDIDDIRGVVYARELYEFLYDKGENVEEIIHQAYIVPDTIGADVLFENMQREKTHFAIVADEYGGFAGIVTMDDLLGEIVGEIEDEDYDEEAEVERDEIVKIGENEWDVDGMAPLEDVAEVTGKELPVDEFDTLSGLVLHSIDYIPDDGATFKVETCYLEIDVTDFKDRRVVRAIVKSLNDNRDEE